MHIASGSREDFISSALEKKHEIQDAVCFEKSKLGSRRQNV